MTTCKVHLLKRPTKLPSGRRVQYWTLRWSDRRGRQRYKSIGRVGKVTRSEAESAKRQMIIALGTGKARQDKPCRMTLSQFIDFHETAFGHGMRATTLIEWRTAGNHAAEALGDKPLVELSWADAGEIRSHLASAGKSDATIRKTLSMFRAMLNRAVKRGMLPENPLADEQLGPPLKRPKRIFEQHEVDAMIDVAPSLSWETLILLAYTSGLRKSELLHLRWQDFDQRAGTIRVEQHHAGRYITDGQDVPILPWQPKTEKSTRTVPIPRSTVAKLLRLKMRSDGSPYIFVCVKRLAALDARAKAGKLRPNYELVNNFTRQFDEIQGAAKAKLSADAKTDDAKRKAENWRRGCFHDLRKTFGTRTASSGVPMHELQAHMGHGSITTTTEYYTEVEKSAADRLRAVFSAVA